MAERRNRGSKLFCVFVERAVGLIDDFTDLVVIVDRCEIEVILLLLLDSLD
jgi:hypothetical protein